MHNWRECIGEFIGITDKGDSVRIYFTSAALDIIESEHVVMQEEVANAMVSRIKCGSFIEKNISNPGYIQDVIVHAEKQAICESFLSNYLPRLIVDSHNIITQGDIIEVECFLTHCGETKNCKGCLECITTHTYAMQS